MRVRPVPLLAAAVLAGGGLVAAAPAPHATVTVSTASQLKSALAAAEPGDTIQLADAVYPGNFTATTPGTAAAPITLTGSSRAVLTASGGYGLHLDGASYWQVHGITVTGGQKGIVLDSATHVTLDSVTVHGLQMEGVHFRRSSGDGVIENSRIYDTGRDRPGYGEGVYVGTAGDLTDRSDQVRILDNTIGPAVRAENVDIKEGTTGGLIAGNSFDGSGLSDANYDDSWVDVKGNGWTVRDNTGVHTLNDGFQVHAVAPDWGCGTVFTGNHADLTGATGADRYAIDVTDYSAACPVTIGAGNTVTGGRGLVDPGVPVG
ncbi:MULTISPECIES: right-handed parallel beta-helix repeat-containing protein [Streptomycetaceae]|uniref:Right handed beta helix domain-containing protein n=1 Tax=Streptantibioticus cattleyicolor (strain ATCC 35852 / DSM 46488 / JCM 4925 / NBRC 14057 / NRRL 8057) TaxID=1003195 RepID=F8JZ15_STREN|nr:MULTISPECIES: right-handed parallel beta-helix repeat-containing protein [Streptomycetaceae]AEW93494.1 hypothetical protein SCATT_11230 [Streptantibioticus cattleyicolor NRRL 8057 = DSM 46488]MYS58204.1 sheath polysaccharide-degrading enzyme [Streptomyces sp. SID5468]CCB73848.1 conserved exported protein of unknown function [Streptantibioticus cattleyicolor NRRL 8057 = DSM 46488]